MRLALLLIIVAIPLLELAVLIRVGQIVGVAATLAIVIATALLGLLTVKRQGFNMVARARQALASGTPPVMPVAEGALVFLAGFLLILPGLIGDTIGVLLLIPPIRRAIAAWSLGRFVSEGTARVRVYTRGMRQGRQPDPNERRGPERPKPKPGPIIEGEYTRIDNPRDEGRKPD